MKWKNVPWYIGDARVLVREGWQVAGYVLWRLLHLHMSKNWGPRMKP